MSGTAAAAAVHLEIAGFEALSEHGHWDACAIIAEMAARHACPWGGIPLTDAAATSALITQWRNEYLTAKRWTPGQGTSLGNIAWHLQAHHAPTAAYIPYSDKPNLDALHNLLKAQLVAGNPIMIQVTRAYNLPHNERGVNVHFVTIGGIDSTLGYLVANGDTTDALASAELIVPTYWATWAQLVAAGLCGAIALDASYKPATPPPPADSQSTATLAQEALAALQRLVAAIPVSPTASQPS